MNAAPMLSLSTYRKRRKHDPATCPVCNVTRRFTPFGWILTGAFLAIGIVLGMLIGIVARVVAP